jgi:TPR repeat protein
MCEDAFLMDLRNKREILLEEKRRRLEEAEAEKLQSESIAAIRKPIDRDFLNNNLQAIWEKIESGNVYAEYVMKKHYVELCSHATDNYNLREMNSKTAELRKRAEDGNVFAAFLHEYLLTIMYGIDRRSQEKERISSEKIFQISKLGNVSAIYTVGFWGANRNSNAPVNASEGLAMIEKAAKEGHPGALYSLGMGYRKGKYGLQKNDAKAKYYLELSSKWGEVLATNELRKSQAGESSGGGCFITSAVCKSLGHPDDCYELMSFRRFRDEWLAYQKDGKALIDDYYRIAPAIVKQIDASNQSSRIYCNLWDDYLSKCLDLIENGAFEECREIYTNMVHSLREKYCANISL